MQAELPCRLSVLCCWRMRHWCATFPRPDLVILKARSMAIGVRVRRPGYAERFPGQFTIRSHRESGAKTELRKIVEGWGDWLFYGHADGSGGISDWLLITRKSAERRRNRISLV